MCRCMALLPVHADMPSVWPARYSLWFMSGAFLRCDLGGAFICICIPTTQPPMGSPTRPEPAKRSHVICIYVRNK